MRKIVWIPVFKRWLSPNFFPVTKGFYRNFDRGMILFANNIASVYVKLEEVDEKAENRIKEFAKDFSRFEKERDFVIRLYSDAVNWAKGVRKKGFENLSDKEITNILIELKEWFEKIGESIWTFHFLLEEKLGDYLQKEKKILNSRYYNILTSISSPPEADLTLKSEIELLKMECEIMENEELSKEVIKVIEERFRAFPYGSYELMKLYVIEGLIKYLNENETIRKKIDQYLFDYGSIFYDYGAKEFLDEDLISGGVEKSKIKRNIYEKLVKNIIGKNMLIDMKMIEADRERREKVKEKYLIDVGGIAREDVYYKYAIMLSWANFVRISRRETLTQIDHYIAPLLKKVVIKFNEKYPENKVNMDEIRFLELEDLISISNGEKKDYTKKIEYLKKGWVWIKENGSVKVLSGDEATKYIYELQERGELPLPKEIFGTIRHLPIEVKEVTGRAKHVFLPEDIEKLEVGDILCTLMTHPSYLISGDYLQRINKCKAIVTEEGTLSCHLLTLFSELSWLISPEIPLITDAKGLTDLIEDRSLIRINFEEQMLGKVKIEKVKG